MKKYISVLFISLMATFLSCSSDETNSKTDGIINFKDSYVAAICIQKFDRNNDSKLSYAEAAAVTNLGDIFRNTNITSFDELQYFVGLDKIDNNTFNGCKKLVSVKIPDNITTINSNAFYNCQSLLSIEIPSSVTYIGNSAFSGCQNLVSINIPNGMTAIERNVFSDCKSLATITIPDGVTSIGMSAFEGCDSLMFLKFPKSVAQIDYRAFYGCRNLKDVTLLSDNIIPISFWNEESYKNIILFVQESLVDEYLDKYSEKFKYILAIGSAIPSDDALIISSGDKLELPSVANRSQEIKLFTRGKWTVNGSADWLTYSPNSGNEGSNTITVTTTSINRTKSARTTKLTISSNGIRRIVTITQRDEYAIFDSKELNLPWNGASVGIGFRTNVDQNKLNLFTTEGLTEWLISGNSDAHTRTEYGGYIYMRALPNETTSAREGKMFLSMLDNMGNPLILDTLFVKQEANTAYHSSDFSSNGKVEMLNIASEGKGIPIVLMGDGFVDKEIIDGTYSRTMKKTLENLFSEEPIKSLRNFFNVYQVTAVSECNLFDGISTAFGTVTDHQTTGIKVNTDNVMKYVKKVEGIDSIHTLAVIILNTNIDKGMTYMIRDTRKDDYSYSIALCPVIDNLESEKFRQMLTHEAIGHGFAKLADESEQNNTATKDDIKLLKEMQEKLGWFMNVDSEKDATKVNWTQFIFDSEFDNEEIDTYEGGYSYSKGIYRSTQESMMRSSNTPFNAPSRQIIYNKVMKLGLGKNTTYKEFVDFDKLHKPTTWNYKTRAQQNRKTSWNHERPRIIWKKTRDRRMGIIALNIKS